MEQIAFFFCLGIIFAKFTSIPFFTLYCLSWAALAASLITLKDNRSFNIFSSLLLFLAGASILVHSYVYPANHIINHRYSYGKVTLRGFVNSEPVISGSRSFFFFRVEEISGNKRSFSACADILVRLPDVNNLRYGEQLILRGTLRRPYGNEGYKAYLHNKGVERIIYVKRGNLLRLKTNKGFFIKRAAFFLKSKMKSVFSKNLSPLPERIISAMLLGERRGVPASLRQLMAETGTVHILVVSGFHVGLVAFMINIFLKILRIPRFQRFSAIIFCLIFYCLLTGASVPAVRATIMIIFMLIGFLFKRQADARNSYGAALTAVFLFAPRQLFDIGFQLSFASVGSLIYIYPKIKRSLPSELFKSKFINILIEGTLVSLCAWLGAMGFIAHYFRIFSPVTVIANLFIVPLASLATLCGFCLLLASQIVPFLLKYFALTCEITVLALLKVDFFLARIPCAYLKF